MFLTIPSLPVLSAPSDGSTNQPTSLPLAWTSTGGFSDTVRYTLQVAQDSNFSVIVLVDSNLTATSRLVTSLSHFTTYFWRVSARNTSGVTAYTSPHRFTTIIAAPNAPLLASPANGATDQPATVPLRWYVSPNSASYAVQVAADSLFVSGVVKNDSSVTDTFDIANGLANSTTYYWRVRATDVGGTSPWSEVSAFTTIVPLPATVALVLPIDGGTVNADSATFVWHSTGPAVTHYQLTICSDSLMTTPVADTTIADTTALVRHIGAPQVYWWNVRAENNAGWSAYGPIRKFTRTMTGVADRAGIPKEFKLSQNYPNPFNPSTIIRFDLPTAQHVHLVIYNIVGEEVEELVDGLVEAGYHHAVFNASNLPSGMYFCRIQSEKFVDVKKMLLIK